jgi:hypothetical protein
MNDLIFKTDGEEKFRIPFPTPGTKCPEMKLEIKMTETDISKVLIDGDYATIMGVKYKRVEEPKPQTLKELLVEWYETANFVQSKDVIANEIVNVVAEWLPKEQSAAGSQNVYVECSVEGFNDCLTEIKGKLR